MLLSHSFQASYVLMPSSKGWVNSMVKAASMMTNLAHTTEREREIHTEGQRDMSIHVDKQMSAVQHSRSLASLQSTP